MAARALREALEGQPRVLAYLERSLAREATGGDAGGVSHAYLFCGGASTEEAARALAQALVCSEGGCGRETCRACHRVAGGSHPDVRSVEPMSARGGYLVEQVHELIADAALTPVEAPRKVYLLKDAHTLGVQAANALLKTLEEPASDVVFILLAPSADAVLPTIRSRCAVVPFAAVDAGAADRLAERRGVSAELARMALGVTGSTVGAASYLENHESLETRRAIIATLGNLSRTSDWDLLDLAHEIVANAHAGVQEEAEAEEDAIAVEEEFLSKTAFQAAQSQRKRQGQAAEKQALAQAIRVVETLLGDGLSQLEGSPEPPLNADAAPLVGELAALGEAPILGALDACREATAHLRRSTTPELILQVFFLSLKEQLCQPSVR